VLPAPHIPDGRTILPNPEGWRDAGAPRSEAEFRRLFDQSGFPLRRIIPTGSLISIIEAAPIS
jgi:hypothetical protein